MLVMVLTYKNNVSVMWGWEKTFEWGQISNFEENMGQHLEFKKLDMGAHMPPGPCIDPWLSAMINLNYKINSWVHVKMHQPFFFIFYFFQQVY